ncbi:MAG TPA: hypothetical protein VF116_05950 [Ktedonobacterales bacterium]
MSSDDRKQGAGSFRQRLDAVLRRRNPAELRAFLVEEGQWEPDARTDEEAAMWMMIAASPVLTDLHAEAERWLMAHGHEHEAQAILGRGGRGPERGKPRASGQGAGRRGPAGRSVGSGPPKGQPHGTSRGGGRGQRTPKV